MLARKLFQRVFRSNLVRNYSLHEHQSKQLFGEYGVKIQKGLFAHTPIGAKEVAQDINGPYIVKANVQAGGRGKGHLTSGLMGGVQFCKHPEDVENIARKMLGYRLITKQTSAEGIPVNSILIYEALEITKQMYLALMLDRGYGSPVCIYSKYGGVSIEDIYAKHPESVVIKPIDVKAGMTMEIARKITEEMDFFPQVKEEAADNLVKLYKLFIEKDATQVEINPWACTDTGEMYCLDAKVNIDDNALYRQEQISKFRDEVERINTDDLSERKAEKFGLNYVSMRGNIGCMVNGAGLAMATMDIIKLSGGEPANFLDVGGGSNEKQMFEAFKLLFGHPSVRSVLVNIFGGIVRCDYIAQSLLKAKQEIGFPCPVVVRLQGNNAEKALEMINNEGGGLLHVEPDLEKASKLAVKLAK